MTTKRSIYQLSALLMAFLMLFSSLGISVDMHYCQGHLKSFSFFGKAKSCYQLADADSRQQCTSNSPVKKMAKTKTCAVDQEACCKSKLIQLLSEQNLERSVNQLIINSSLQSAVLTLAGLFWTDTIKYTSFIDQVHYKVPLFSRDIYVYLETFLL